MTMMRLSASSSSSLRFKVSYNKKKKKKNDKGRGAYLEAHSTKLHADEALPSLSPHSFQALETQSSTTLKHGPTESQALAMEGSASTKEG
jgi:predicted RNA-binding protein YlxR (DUF448 family)